MVDPGECPPQNGPFQKGTDRHLSIISEDGWKMIVSFWDGATWQISFLLYGGNISLSIESISAQAVFTKWSNLMVKKSGQPPCTKFKRQK